MDEQYPPPTPSLTTYYPSGYPPIMPPEVLHQPRLHQLQTLSMDKLGSYSDYDDPTQTALPPPNPQRSRRRQPAGSDHVKHRRTRSGCYTCRQRRVKCDEARPICERCRKGKRECTYPGNGLSSTSPSAAKTSRSGSRSKESPGASSLSGSDADEDDKVPLSSIPDEDEDDGFEDESQSAISQNHGPSDTPVTSPKTESSSLNNRTRARSQVVRNSSRQSTKSEAPQSGRWASLPKDVKHYLNYHRENMSYHHYAFRYDGASFLTDRFLDIALNDGSAALLYSIVAFAAYHQTVALNEDNISIFLSYYNKSIAHLQQSLKHKRHNVATLLTILQLATIEEFLGDWVNLMGHQKAAHQILTNLFTPETIMNDEPGRTIINWYIRFDLIAAIMSGGEPALDRRWMAAAANFYQREARERPNDLGARFDAYFATSRLLATDVSLLFARRTQQSISDNDFFAGVERLSSEFAEFSGTIEKAFMDPSCFVRHFPRAPPPPASTEQDLFDSRDPHFLYAGPLSTMNFVLVDFWGIELMFKYQVTMAMGQPTSPDLTKLAMKSCKMFEAIQYGEESGSISILSCQTSLGILPLFLPREQRYMMWARRKFADVEKLGLIYPATLRTRMTENWGQNVLNWWLPDGEDYPNTIRTIREFVAYRATKATEQWTADIRDIRGVFGTLHIEEQAGSGEAWMQKENPGHR